MSSQRKKKACNYLQRDLLVWENAGIQFINKAQRNHADVIENSRESFSAFSSFLWWKVLRLHHCHYSGTSSHSLPTRTYAVDVVPKWPHVSSPVSPEAAAAATAAATRSWCAKKKNPASPPEAVGGQRRPRCPNHPLPRQHSSRQQLQQINLPLTVHLE